MTVPHLIDQAFILAAGKGARMRPLTDTCPKPMLHYKGRPIIDHMIDKLVAHGVKRVVINLHYLGDIIQSHLKSRQDIDICYSQEETLLETGGGLKKGLAHLAPKPFFVTSGDGPWEEKRGQDKALKRLEDSWQAEIMDILMLLQPVSTMSLTRGVGDYTLLDSGQAVRQLDKNGTHMFTGVRIVSPKIFDMAPSGAFSFLELMDRAQNSGRLYGLEHRGIWHHLSTPDDLKAVETAWQAGTV